MFSFLTSNADMHLKNFSLIRQPALGMVLSAAYDLVAIALVNPADKEELGLTHNGKKKKINRTGFLAAFHMAGLDKKQQENIFKKMEKNKSAWMKEIEIGFLSGEFKKKYKNLLEERFLRLK